MPVKKTLFFLFFALVCSCSLFKESVRGSSRSLTLEVFPARSFILLKNYGSLELFGGCDPDYPVVISASNGQRKELGCPERDFVWRAMVATASFSPSSVKFSVENGGKKLCFEMEILASEAFWRRVSESDVSNPERVAVFDC